MNQTHKPFDNLHIRTAIAYAVNKQSYIDAFYAGLAEPADNWMPPATQFWKALNLPTYDVQKAKDEVAASGLTGDALKLDFWYPSDVARPYMPDPKGLAEAIATDLEAVGFTVTFHTAGWRTGYLADEAVGKYPMWLLGWTCDWPGPDNFLEHGVLPLRRRQAEPGVRLRSAGAQGRVRRGGDRPRRGRGQGGLGEGPGHPGQGPPDRSARPLEAAGRGQGLRQGLPRRGQPERADVSRLARQVTSPLASGVSFPRGHARPRGNASSRRVTAGAEVHRASAARSDPGPHRAVDHPVRVRPPAPGRPGHVAARAARDARAAARDPQHARPRQAALRAVLPVPRPARPGRSRQVDHQQPDGRPGARPALPGDDRADRRGADLRGRPRDPARSARGAPRPGLDRRRGDDHLAARDLDPDLRPRPDAPVHLRRPAQVPAGVGSDRPAAPRRAGHELRPHRFPADGQHRGVRRRAEAPDPAGDRARLDPARDHLPDHPGVRPRCQQRGLRPDRPGQGPVREAGRLAPHHAQRLAARS